MKEVLKLRPHHATALRDYLNRDDTEELTDKLESDGYDTQVILTILSILSKLRDPQQVIEILPEEDVLHDPICQNCQQKRQLLHCDDPPLLPRIGIDGYEALRFDLEPGRQLTAQELLKKKEAFGPDFRI